MQTKPEKEHEWLKQFIGEWTYFSDLSTAPGEKPTRYTGTESVRPFGDLWIQAEGKGEMPGGGEARMLLTVGYDPKKGRYVGSWMGSMMALLWVYEGDVDASGKVLTLNTTGPDCTDETKTANYQERLELLDDGGRTFTSIMVNADGTKTELMKVTYARVK